MISTLFKCSPCSPKAVTATETGPVPLSHLRCKEEALVVDVEAAPVENARLAEMGLTPGAVVKVICAGRTRLFRVGGTSLSLRSDDLDAIMVERLG